MPENEPFTDPDRAEPVVPHAADDPKGDFCAYNPELVDRAIRLQMKFNRYYKGVVLFGPCPRCPHQDGINLFIPTTWATVTGTGGPSVAYIQQIAPPQAPATPDTAQPQAVEGWVSYTTEPRYDANELVEVIVCRCGQEHLHQPPSGRSVGGYWAYLHLPNGTIRDDQRAR